MAANKRRGEFEAEIGGNRYRFRLTMGAMAEIEDANGGKPFVQALIDAGVSGISARRMIECFRVLVQMQHPADADAIMAEVEAFDFRQAREMWTNIFRASGIVQDEDGEVPLEPAS